MSRASHSPRTVFLLGAMGAVLALVVGLVGSAGRASPRVRSAPATASWASEPAHASLHTPEVLPPFEETLVAKAAAKAPSAAPARDVREARARLSGLVLRPDGEPASRARIVLGTERASCDADGRFELLLQSGVGGADLLAWEPGHEPVLRPAFGGSLAEDGESQVRLVLGPETLTLEGTVLATDGRPASGWTVELDELDPLVTFGLREPVQTDEGGRFVLGDVPDGTHVVRAWKSSPQAAFRSTPAASGTSGLTIVVAPEQ